MKFSLGRVQLQLPVFGIGVGLANMYYYDKLKERFKEQQYDLSSNKALLYGAGKTCVYTIFAPFVVLHLGARGYKAYKHNDLDWFLPTIMPGWSLFVKKNPEYAKYDSIMSDN